jgi:hypothetical protein
MNLIRIEVGARAARVVNKRQQGREAREAEWKVRAAELNRVSRSDNARARQAWKKAEAARDRELSKLIGALGMLGSDFAGERAAAALMSGGSALSWENSGKI